MIKGYRVITDVPQGICLGFMPEGFVFDVFDVHDNGGYNAFYQQDHIIVSYVEELGGEAPADMMVWRTYEEFKIWKEEMDE
jgi:hypothetical protein